MAPQRFDFFFLGGGGGVIGCSVLAGGIYGTRTAHSSEQQSDLQYFIPTPSALDPKSISPRLEPYSLRQGSWTNAQGGGGVVKGFRLNARP